MPSARAFKAHSGPHVFGVHLFVFAKDRPQISQVSNMPAYFARFVAALNEGAER